MNLKGYMKFKPFVLGALGGIVGLALIPLSGLLDPGARPGRGDVAQWFNALAVRQGVALRSFDAAVPNDLDDPARVRRAAGHYEMVCAECHASPTRAAGRVAQDMEPAPPHLMDRMREWRPVRRLFYTVKHGVAGSAMPAWPSLHRDDEVWDMVAFLRALPDIDPAAYAAMAERHPSNTDCAMCHGTEGAAGPPGLPRLDIQSPDYLAASLEAFKGGVRNSGTMIAASWQLSEAEITALSARLGQRVTVPLTEDGPGAVIAREGIPHRRIPACDSCHGETARADYPRLGGQDRDYLRTQLKLFMDEEVPRGGLHAEIMEEAVRFLREDEAEALADYYGR